MKAKGLIVSMTVATALVSGAVQAQYAGPGQSSGSLTVKEILADPNDDQEVTLRGKLLRKTGDEDYVFSDGTGEITVEIDDDDFPQVRIDENTLVEIHGEVDTSLRRPPEIDVDSLRVASEQSSQRK